MLLRYTASADNTIVNAFNNSFSTRGTGSNTGLADVLEVFSIYGRQQPSSSTNVGSQELSRILIQFPIASVTADRTNGVLPASGSVNFYLRLFNAQHSKTVPRNFKLLVQPVSQSWQEGEGLDLENYKDVTNGNPGSNWLSASNTSAWVSPGGDYLTNSASLMYEQTFASGLEDLEVNITPLVEKWIAGTAENYGMGIYLSSSFEAYFSGSNGANSGSVLNNLNGAKKSYFTKRFFARGTQYFFKKPLIEARWNSSRRDQRSDFYFSSSLAPGAENLNTLFIYNFIRGKLTNIPSIGTGKICVSLFSGSSDNTKPSTTALSLFNGKTTLTGGYVSTGIYSCSIGIVSSSTNPLYDVWFSGSDSASDASKTTRQFFTGSIVPKSHTATTSELQDNSVIKITNLQEQYSSKQKERFNLFVRNRDWNPTIYTKATQTIPTINVQSASYSVTRTIDNLLVVPHGTGSDKHTILSYDDNGNYFDFDMSILEAGYQYKFSFAFYDERLKKWKQQNNQFKFKVV